MRRRRHHAYLLHLLVLAIMGLTAAGVFIASSPRRSTGATGASALTVRLGLPALPVGFADELGRIVGQPTPDEGEQLTMVAPPAATPEPVVQQRDAAAPPAVATAPPPRPRRQRDPRAGATEPASPEATPTPGPRRPDAVAIAYTVAEGDTISGIAEQLGVSAESILWNNIDISDADQLHVGQQLQIPAVDGILYHVVLGDTLTEIAENHGVGLEDILRFWPNRLRSPQDLRGGVLILIPGGTPPSPEAPPAVELPIPTPTPEPTPEPTEEPSAEPTPDTPADQPPDAPPADPSVLLVGKAHTTDRLRLRKGAGLEFEVVTVMPFNAAVQVLDAPVGGFYPVKYNDRVGWAFGEYLKKGPPKANAVQDAPVGSYGFRWPLYGSINSYFGPGHPLGIDIGTNRVTGLPIVASLDGTVVFAGGSPCCSYGLYIVIQHGNGFTTRYAHLSQIDVSVGQWVVGGQQIGLSGNTGYSTGPHLHFEIRLNGVPVNPLNYLP